MNRLKWFVALVAVIALPATAEIYRCEIDGVSVFSDRPCQDDATPYRPAHGLSVSGSVEDLARTMEGNQQWLAQEEQRRETRRAERAEQRAHQAAATPPVHASQPRLNPVLALPYFASPPPMDRRHTRDGRAPEPSESREEGRFSALSGRQPGSRRDP